MFTISETNRGVEALLFQNYTYRLISSQSLTSGNILWRCTNKKCNGRIHTDPQKCRIVWNSDNHNHDPLSSKRIEENTMSCSAKRKAVEDLNAKPNKIMRAVLKESNHTSSNGITNMRNQIYRRRRKVLPPLPKSKADALQQLFNKQKSITTSTSDEEQFLYVPNSKSLAILTCETNLKFLCDPEVKLYADGTFKNAPRFFTQLYTIHGFKNGFYVPLVYAFLDSKDENKYVEMWNFIKYLCASFKLNLNPTSIRMDFEKAAHNSIHKSFPTCTVLGCRFHLGQSWYRQLNENFPKLREMYKKVDSEVGKWLSYFFGLAFLPAHEVGDGFADLMSIAPKNDDCELFADYILKSYVDSATFPPEIWAEEPNTERRTTNGAEAFHRHYNSCFYHVNPQIWNVIEVLRGVQVETKIKIRDVREGKIKALSEQYRKKVDKILLVGSEYKSKTISRLDLLKKLGYINRAIDI